MFYNILFYVFLIKFYFIYEPKSNKILSAQFYLFQESSEMIKQIEAIYDYQNFC